MDATFLSKQTERNHQVAIDNLALSMNRSKDGINVLYGIVLRHYSRRARIKAFLSPLVTKRVKELLRDSITIPEMDERRRRSSEF